MSLLVWVWLSPSDIWGFCYSWKICHNTLEKMEFNVVQFNNFSLIVLFRSFKTVHTSTLKMSTPLLQRRQHCQKMLILLCLKKKKHFEIIKIIMSLSIFSSEFDLSQFLSYLTNSKAKCILKNNYVPPSFLENSMNRKEEDQINTFTWKKTGKTLILHTSSSVVFKPGQTVWTWLLVI